MTHVQSEQRGAKVRVPPPLVFLGLIALGLGLQRWRSLPALPLAFWLRVSLGAAALVSGALIVVTARAWFARTGQHPAPWKPSPELLVNGIYRRTRNPMYLGLTLFQLGLGIALDNAWIAVASPVALALVHFLAVRPEEAYLTEKFGEDYLRYKAAVRRYL